MSIWGSSNAITIDCEYKIDSYDSNDTQPGTEPRIQLSNLYSCSSAVISNKCDSSSVTSGVTRAHMPEMSNEDVKLIKFKRHQNFSIVPRDVRDFFSKP